LHVLRSCGKRIFLEFGRIFFMEQTLCWIWLQKALGISSSLQTAKIIELFRGGAQEIYEAGERERRISGAFSARQLQKLADTPLRAAEEIMAVCAKKNMRVVTPQQSAYPQLLSHLPNPPLVLYMQGTLEVLENRLTIALVGARKATPGSVDIALRLAAELAKADCVVVSGGALGIDTAAHTGALWAKGETIAVLGCGLDVPYLAENAALRERIAAQGVVLSEFPPGTAPTPYNFPVRNRILSGLSRGVVVVEAGERSGSLITANCALEQGRDVFACPGALFANAFKGANALIKAGAKPIFSARDILEEYTHIFPALRLDHVRGDLENPAANPATVPVKRTRRQSEKEPPPFPPPFFAQDAQPPPPTDAAAPPKAETAVPKTPSQKILDRLRGGPLHPDDLQRELDLPPGALSEALLLLEMDGLVTRTPQNLYAYAK
jgi:DNA processing protein